MLPGENKFGTSPVRASYWGFMPVELQSDLEAVSSFTSSANYPNPMNALEAEWGSTRNVRWLLNTNGFNNGAATPVFSNFIMGQEAYGVVRLGEQSAQDKFSLIDLDILSDEDDRAQADEPEWLLAA